MAGDWIKLAHCTPDKPEVVQVADALGIDQDAALGKLCRLWIWADQQSLDGHALSVTESFIDRLTVCPGFAKALAETGWLKQRKGGFSIPNFDRHNGETAKARGLALKRQQKKRSRNCHAGSVTDALPETEAEIEPSISATAARSATAAATDAADRDFEFWEDRIGRIVPVSDDGDLEFQRKIALACAKGKIPEFIIAGTLDQLRVKSLRNPCGYLRETLAGKCSEAGLGKFSDIIGERRAHSNGRAGQR